MKRKALITATAVLLVAVMCLATASYAWFTAGTATDIAELNVSIKVESDGLYIAPANVLTTTPTFECGTFTTNAITEDLKAVGFITDKLDAVSTNGILTEAGVLQFHQAPTGTFDGSTWDAEQVNAANTLPEGTANYGYEYFAFYVKSDAQGDYTIDFDGTLFADEDALATMKIAYSVTDATVDVNSGKAATAPADVKDLTIYKLGGDATTYKPLIGTGTDCIELKNQEFVATAGNEDILDSTVTVENALVEPTLSFGEGGGAKLVTVAVWVEGQDPQCYGTLEIDGKTLTMSIA